MQYSVFGWFEESYWRHNIKNTLLKSVHFIKKIDMIEILFLPLMRSYVLRRVDDDDRDPRIRIAPGIL